MDTAMRGIEKQDRLLFTDHFGSNEINETCKSYCIYMALHALSVYVVGHRIFAIL